MLILIFKCATDGTTKTKWWSLTSLVLWAFDFWSQGVNTGLWRSQFKITWIRRHHIGRGLEADSRCSAPPRSRGRQCCILESQIYFTAVQVWAAYFLLSCPYLFRCQNVDLLWSLLDQLIPPHQAQVFGWKGTWTNWLPMSEFVLCLCKPGEEVDENLANPRSHLVSCRGAEVDI